jgi:hypothetical protein
MNRIALGLVAGLTLAWIVLSLLLLHGWTGHAIASTLATWVAIPVAAWLGGLAWAAARRNRDSTPS